MTRPALQIVTTVPRSLHVLLDGQPRRLAQDFEVTVVASPGPELDATAVREDVSAHAVAMSRSLTPASDLRALWSLYRWFRRTRPEVVQSYTPKAGLLAMAAALLARVPVRVHGIVGMPLMETHGWRRRLLGVTERLTYRMSTDLICNSTGLTTWVTRHLSPGREVNVVGHGSINGVDLDHFAPAAAEVRQQERRRLGIGSEDTVFVFVGRLVRDKGVEELLQAFDRLLQGREHVVLVLVGDQEQIRDSLSDQAVARLGRGDGVVQLGWRDDVRPVLAAADVCVLPSYREGLPNSLLEAAASGLPVVATDINGCNEVVEPGRTGLLVPPRSVTALHDAFTMMLDPDLRGRMGAAGRRRVSALYAHDDLCSALVAFYHDALRSATVPVDGLPQPR